jgi:RHS repeat-associated protein
MTNRWQEQFGYNYDGAGNLNQRTNYTLLQNFGVNNLNELTTLTNTGQLTVAGSTTSPATNVTVNSLASVLYADRSFASTNQSWASGNNTYTAIARDLYARSSTNSITVNLQTTNSFRYDLNGNLLSDGTRNFTYDDENQLIAVWTTDGYSNNFVYDGKLRRRIERDYQWNVGTSGWIATNEVHFIYDGNLVVQERNTNNLPTVTYTRGNDLSSTLQGAGGIGGLLARTDMGQWIGDSSFAHALYHADGNGNVTCLCYANGCLAAKYLYDPFGNTLAQYGSLANVNNYRFSSKEWNANSGLYYYLYRFYDPNLQKWLNRDPLGERGGINLYECVVNDALLFVDTDGKKPVPGPLPPNTLPTQPRAPGGITSPGNSPVTDPADTSPNNPASGSGAAGAVGNAIAAIVTPVNDPNGPGLIATICAAFGKHPFDPPPVFGADGNGFKPPPDPAPQPLLPLPPVLINPIPLQPLPPTVTGGPPNAPPPNGCSVCPVNSPAV